MTSDSDDDYKVGYRKPPKTSQFKPGKSGNPQGRPRAAKNLATIFEEELNMNVSVTENGKRKKIPKRRAVVRRAIHNALEGEDKSIMFLLERISRHEKKHAMSSEDDRSSCHEEAEAMSIEESRRRWREAQQVQPGDPQPKTIEEAHRMWREAKEQANAEWEEEERRAQEEEEEAKKDVWGK